MTSERVDPPQDAPEAEQVFAFLDYHRATLAWKTEGLDAAQLGQRLPTSEMTLGGMLKHMALVEESWFCRVFRGREFEEPWASVDWDADEDWDWHSATEDSPEELRALWDAGVAKAREAVTGAALEDRSVRPSRHTGEPFNLRWIVLHMVEEYARHNGHADLLREAIDGATGE